MNPFVPVSEIREFYKCAVDGTRVRFSLCSKNFLKAYIGNRSISLRGLTEERCQVTSEKVANSYLKSVSIQKTGQGELILSHPLKGGGSCVSSKSVATRADRHARDYLALSQIKERQGRIEEAIAHCTQALGSASQSLVPQILIRIRQLQQLKEGEILPAAKQDEEESIEFSRTFDHLIQKLDGHELREAKNLLKKLLESNFNVIEDVSYYCNALFEWIENEARFRSIDESCRYQIKQGTLLLLRKLTFSFLIRIKEKGMAMETLELERKRSVIKHYDEWIRRNSLNELYYQISYLKALFKLFPDTQGFSDRAEIGFYLNQITEDIFSLCPLLAAFHAVKGVTGPCIKTLSEIFQGDRRQKTVNLLVCIGLLHAEALKQKNYALFGKAMYIIVNGAKRNWKVYYKLVGDWGKLIREFIETPEALLMVMGDEENVGLRYFTTFRKSNRESGRIRERAFRELIALWNQASDPLKGEIQRIFQEASTIEQDNRLQSLFEGEEAACIRMGERIPDSS